MVILEQELVEFSPDGDRWVVGAKMFQVVQWVVDEVDVENVGASSKV